jgi:hypothetical protein
MRDWKDKRVSFWDRVRLWVMRRLGGRLSVLTIVIRGG